MRKLLITVLTVVMIYSIYYDLKIGTLPSTNTSLVAAENHLDPVLATTSIPYEEIIVEPGYTVLSIVEELHIGPVEASIQQIVHDFEALNPNTNASNIQIGKAYLFPIYYR